MLHAEGFKGFLIFLVAAGVIVPLFHRARIGTVLGFLLVGVVLGPFGLGRLAEAHPWLRHVTFDDPARVAPLAELGIMFLLFLLGLELSLQRLWQLRRYVLGVGAAQVLLSALAIGLVMAGSGVDRPGAVALGLCLALSSTAIVMQVLHEQRRTVGHVGRIALSVLLFQDLMVVPILFVVGVLGKGAEGAGLALLLALAQAFATVAAIMVAGRYVVRPLLRSAARTGSRDLIMAITLLIVVGISAATEASGLSMALGAFLAGLLLSESEYRHHIEIDLEPFKGLLLGLFFVTVGTSVDVLVVIAQAGWIALAVVSLLAVKAAILFGVARAFGVAAATAVEVALLLAQAGEFAFVVIGLASASKLLSPELSSAAVAAVGLTMLVTPILAVLARRAAARLEPLDHAGQAPDADTAKLEEHVIIGGFGRVGQTIAQLLEREQVPFVALDPDAALVTEQRRRGRAVYFGDASRREILERAGAAHARAFVVTLDAPGAAERMVQSIMALRKDAAVFARAKDAAHAARLARLGALDVIPEAVEASLQLAGRLLGGLDLPKDVVEKRLAEAREAEAAKLGPRKTTA
jgi:CPA2 family monovalent cation:H+ antiporter-2